MAQATITKEKIKHIADTIAREFKPEKIILFGSYAWGKPHEDSDIDLLVVKDTKNPRDLVRKISSKFFPRDFAMDVLVQTPKGLEEKINIDRNLFLEDIVQNGITLYAHH